RDLRHRPRQGHVARRAGARVLRLRAGRWVRYAPLWRTRPGPRSGQTGRRGTRRLGALRVDAWKGFEVLNSPTCSAEEQEAMSRVFWTAALCAATAMLVGCNRSSPGPSAARLKVDGQVQLDTPRQLFELTSGKHTVHYGDRIKVLSGSAVLERGDGGTLELRRDTEIRFDAHPALLAGSTLAAAGKEPLVVEAAGSSLSVDRGAARLTRTLAVSAASYTGALTIESVGQTLEVPALREATVATAGVLPAHLSPISYNGHNTWDRRYLGVAIELADQLQARSDGLTSTLEPGEGTSAGFYSTVLPRWRTSASSSPRC